MVPESPENAILREVLECQFQKAPTIRNLGDLPEVEVVRPPVLSRPSWSWRGFLETIIRNIRLNGF